MNETHHPTRTGQPVPSLITITHSFKLVIWFGLFAGLSEAAFRGTASAVFARVYYFDPATVWMAPVADVFLFSTGILILVPLEWAVRRKAPSLRSFVFVLAFLSCLSLLLLLPKLYFFAKVAIAVGLAVQ